MSKIILTLEDTKDDDGRVGMTIKWDGDTDDDGGPAHAYTKMFIEYVLSQSQQAAIIDEEDIMPPDTTLN